ncbi:MAG: DUF1292 domain-containing protein [Firmicutes bacterium]|nr:DUF1292 domain-containing protein [Bacillota bacterium]
MAEKKATETNSIVRLLDPNDAENVILYDEEDNAVEFEQVALIPQGDKRYIILKPVEFMEGVADDEAIAFVVQQDDEGDEVLVVVEEEPVIDEVFAAYHKLLEEDEKKSKNKKK